MNVIPGGTAELILKHTFVGLEESATEEQLNQISSRYNLDDPLYIQFFRWLKSAVSGEGIGVSYVYKKPVLYLLALRLPATIELAGASMAIAVLVGISLGIYSALRENKVFDQILDSSPFNYHIFFKTETDSCSRIWRSGKPVTPCSSFIPAFYGCDYESHPDKHA